MMTYVVDFLAHSGTQESLSSEIPSTDQLAAGLAEQGRLH